MRGVRREKIALSVTDWSTTPRSPGPCIWTFPPASAWPEGDLNGNRILNNIVLREPGSAGEPAVLHIRRPDQGVNATYTLAQLETIYPDAANNLEVDPRFTGEANRVFAIRAGSPAIDRGMVIAGVTFRGAAPDPLLIGAGLRRGANRLTALILQGGGAEGAFPNYVIFEGGGSPEN